METLLCIEDHLRPPKGAVVNTCLDYGIDYPHAPVHCPACWEDQQQARMVAALEEANDLQKRSDAEWVEPRPRAQPRPTYILPDTTPKQRYGAKGGIQIEPRR